MRPYAASMSAAVVVRVMPPGRGRENSLDMKSARSSDISMIALYMRCCIMFWRRMSMMNAMRGLSAAM